MRTLFFRHKVGIASEPHVLQLQQTWPGDSILLDGKCGTWRGGTQIGIPNTLTAAAGEAQLRAMLWSDSHRRAIRRYSPDVIIAHTAMDGLRISKIAAHLRIPVVVICHGSDVLASPEQMKQISYSGRQLSRRWPQLAKSTFMFVAISEFLGRALQVQLGPANNPEILCHYLGTNALTQYRNDAPREHDLLFVGRLRPNKGPHIFVDIVKRILASGIEVSATIVGDGSMRQTLVDYVQSVGLDRNIRFLGALPQEQVFEIMSRHRLIIVPSLEINGGVSEGFGLASIEAQALGTPALVSPTGGLPESVVPGVTGEIAANADRFAQVAATLLRDAERWHRYSEAAHHHVDVSFNREVQTAKLYSTLRERVEASRASK